jgi:flagellar assembly factor FliW
MLAMQAQPSENVNNLREFFFPRGVAGFPNAKRFAFIYQGKGNMLCLQSIDQAEASFILTPWDTKKLGNTPPLSHEQQACLNIANDKELHWFLVLNPFADRTWVTANLKAPIVISESEQTGLQCIRNQVNLDLRFPWMKQPNQQSLA